MKKQANIFLVGPMGSGKTTVGKHLADFLRYDFYDSDQDIETSTGASISWIFDKEGEAGFRKREEKALSRLTQKQHIILATGGGAVLSKQNRNVLSQRGTVVYLKATADVLIRRTKKDKNRPLLQTNNPAEVIERLLGEREHLYADVSDVIIETSDISAKEMAKKIIAEINQTT